MAENTETNPGKWDHPVLSFNQSMEICEQLYRMGGSTTVDLLAKEMGSKMGGWFALQMASLRRWRLIDGRGTVKISPIYTRIVAPRHPDDDKQAKMEAFLSIPLFKDVYDKYKEHGLPEEQYLVNALRHTYNLNGRNPTLVANIIREFITENVPEYGTIAMQTAQTTQSIPSSGVKSILNEPKPTETLTGEGGFMVEINVSGQLPFRYLIKSEKDWMVVKSIIEAAQENWEAQRRKGATE